eukprot:132845-Amphidinium_carterae.1
MAATASDSTVGPARPKHSLGRLAGFLQRFLQAAPQLGVLQRLLQTAPQHGVSVLQRLLQTAPQLD